MKKTIRDQIVNILYRYSGDDTYVASQAVDDILKLFSKTHLLHKCNDEIAELKDRVRVLEDVNKQLIDELYEFSIIKVKPKEKKWK